MAPGTFRGTYESFLGAVHPEDRGMVDTGVQQAVADGSTYDVEFRVPSADGGTRWVAGHGQVYVDAEGNPARMIGIGRDVTETRRAAENLAKAVRGGAGGPADPRRLPVDCGSRAPHPAGSSRPDAPQPRQASGTDPG